MLFETSKRESIFIPLPSLQIYINPSQAARAEYLLKHIPNKMKTAYEKGAMAFAARVLKIVKRAMATGMPPPGSGVSWKPLADKTTRMYDKWGHSNSHPWYVIGEMHNLVNVFKNSRGNYYVGFKTGQKATNPNPNGQTENRPTLSKLSHILESTGDNHTARPLWQPAYDSAGGKAKLAEILVKELRAQVRSMKGWTVDSRGNIRDSKYRKV